MPAKDKFHRTLKNALRADGWKITKDPMYLKYEKRAMYIDLAAEKVFLAERKGRKIAVEVKSFVGLSSLKDLQQALGQFLLYRLVLEELDPKRTLFLAITEEIFQNVLDKNVGRLAVQKYNIPLIVFDEETEVITKWIH